MTHNRQYQFYVCGKSVPLKNSEKITDVAYTASGYGFQMMYRIRIKIESYICARADIT